MRNVTRVILSFLSTILAWQIGFATYFVWAKYIWQDTNDWEAMWFFPGIYIITWWVVFVFPLDVLLKKKQVVYGPFHGMRFGSIYGLMGFLILLTLTNGGAVLISDIGTLCVVYALIVGGVTGMVHHYLLPHGNY